MARALLVVVVIVRSLPFVISTLGTLDLRRPYETQPTLLWFLGAPASVRRWASRLSNMLSSACRAHQRSYSRDGQAGDAAADQWPRSSATCPGQLLRALSRPARLGCAGILRRLVQATPQQPVRTAAARPGSSRCAAGSGSNPRSPPSAPSVAVESSGRHRTDLGAMGQQAASARSGHVEALLPGRARFARPTSLLHQQAQAAGRERRWDFSTGDSRPTLQQRAVMLLRHQYIVIAHPPLVAAGRGNRQRVALEQAETGGVQHSKRWARPTTTVRLATSFFFQQPPPHNRLHQRPVEASTVRSGRLRAAVPPSLPTEPSTRPAARVHAAWTSR